MRSSLPSRARWAVLVPVAVCASLLVPGAGDAGAAVPAVPVAQLSWPAGSGTSYPDAGAESGTTRLTWSNATGTGTVPATVASSAVVVRAAGDQCAGAPLLQVAVDGRPAGTAAVATTGWTVYTFPGAYPSGAHQVSITFPNDAMVGGCDRNLRLDTVQFAPAAAGSPLAGPMYVDPQSNAARTAAALRSSDPAGAALFDKIAGQPESEFFGDWVPTAQLRQVVAGRVAAAGAALPLYVLYAIPHRDCGSYSGGGLADATAYHDWVSQFAAGLGAARAAVVLEPDALPQMDCLSADDQQSRLAMLRDAVGQLAADPAAIVYLDAGNSTWQPVSVMTARLQAAGVASTRGFSLNVSNFNATRDELAYGDALSGALGDKHFVVDTSRNGNGPTTTWCNPDGRALGARPTTATGDVHADALLWVKRVGESDGTCNGGPASGTWWPDYARGLAARASW